MPRKKYTPEEIIINLRSVEVEQSKGLSFEQSAKKIGVTVQTLARWRKEYSGLGLEQAKRLKELEKENSRLKRLVADKELDILILKETCKGKF
jgi:transcriptional regulator with XRE-family HTH domain